MNGWRCGSVVLGLLFSLVISGQEIKVTFRHTANFRPAWALRNILLSATHTIFQNNNNKKIILANHNGTDNPAGGGAESGGS